MTEPKRGGTGSLTIVGLGPARAEHLTVEAVEVLHRAARDGHRVYGLGHVRALVAAVEPMLEVRSLDYLYDLPGVDRPTAYRDLADMLVRRAFDDGLDVVYAVAGSPLFVNDSVLRVRERCARSGLPLRLVHGVSFVDLVLDRVFWTGHVGLQLMSAWNVARDRLALSTSSPALLCQLGEFSRGGDAVDAGGSPAILVELRDALLQRYPPDHPCVLLYSSGHPDYRSLARSLVLGALADAAVPVYANLWVPALDGPALERLVAPGPGQG